jgi:hypothetical protein
MLLIAASKSLSIASPWFLKSVVDNMALGACLNWNLVMIGIGGFAATRILSTVIGEYRMFQIS